MNRKQRRAQAVTQLKHKHGADGVRLCAGQYGERRVVLHVGCGSHPSELLEREFPKPSWVEVRLDIDAGVAPDIIGSITDMQMVASTAVDAVFSSHNLEHLFAHEVPSALREFSRVLKPTGFALIGVPDLQRVAELVAQDKLTEPAYVSPAGPIAPIDMLYGHRDSLAQGHLFMAHKMGFTARTLAQALVENGFARAEVTRAGWDLWAIGKRT